MENRYICDMKKKEQKPMFVLPLIDCEMTTHAEKIIRDKMNAYKIIYNRLVSEVNKAIRNNMDKVEAYRAGEMKKSDLLKSIDISYDYPGKDKYAGLTEYAFINAQNTMIKEDMGGGKKYNEVVDTGNVREIARELTKACEKAICGSKEGTVPSLKYKESCNVMKFPRKKDGFRGIKINLINSTLTLSGEEIKYHIDDTHYYEMYAMGNPIREICFVRKKIRGKEKFYVQFSIEGVPYRKDYALGNGTVAIDMGPRTFYVLRRNADGTFERHEFSLSALDGIDSEVARIQRKIDRSRRSTTPENYDEQGRAKKKGERIPYRESNRNIRNLDRLSDMRRKLQARKEIEENGIIRKILSLGYNFSIEYSPGMTRSWMTRKKETKMNKNGRFASKKRYGKSILNSAPYRILQKLELKAGQLGAEVREVPTAYGCTGFDHTNGTYTKHGVGERKVTLSNGNTHHRDFHSCFNIMFAGKSKGEFLIKEMEAAYPMYCECDLEK